MNNKRWYRRCKIMAVLAVALSASDALTPGGASFGGQMAAAVLLIGAGVLAHMTYHAP